MAPLKIDVHPSVPDVILSSLETTLFGDEDVM